MSKPAAPATNRKDRKRAEIIAIAQALFFEAGYAQTSMSQIAARVGGSKATLYNHFQSKEELLKEVVADVVATRPQDYDETTMPELTEIRAWLMWFGRSLTRKITAPNYIALQRLAAAEALRYPEIGKSFHDAMMPGIDMITGTFATAMEKGVLRRADPKVAAQHFMELCLGWTVRRMVWNIQATLSEPEIDKTVGEAISTFMDGYAART